ncbi:MAG TPA: DUF2752 domain-containing protein [Anaeromyxobacter sp.]|nr:DUF2752 domain-containing protein [Anaeromyxobacter sp.]
MIADREPAPPSVERFRPPRTRLGVPEVYAAVALLSFLVARFVPVLDLDYPCVFLTLTGHPCATCGMTHAFVRLAHGQVAEAFRWNPLGALFAAAAWAFAALDLVRVVAGLSFPVVPREKLGLWLRVGVAAFFANWAYLWLHGLGP